MIRPLARSEDNTPQEGIIMGAQPEAEIEPAAEPLTPEVTEPEQQAETPPWGDDFDAEKAWERIQKQSRDIDKFRKQGILTEDQKTKLAEYDRLVEASKTELEMAQEAASTANSRIESLLKTAVAAKVEAFAANGFADPSDAGAFLDLTKYADEDGSIDDEAIKTDLKDLLDRKPHLAKEAGVVIPRPNPGQGSSGGGAPDMATLVAEAKKRGDWKTVIALENKKLTSKTQG